MAKKSMIARQNKRIYLVNKYAKQRKYLKDKVKETHTVQGKYDYLIELRKLPRDSSYVRLHNRCQLTGRPKGYYRDFGLSRIALREMFHKGLLPGVFKRSW